MTKYKARTKDDKCPFCAVVSGKLQTYGVFWQDDDFMAFLSIDPNTEGFSCVIPKKHLGSDVLRMPDDKLQQFIIVAKKVSRILEDYFTDVGRVGLMMEGTGIDHAHIKLFPMHGTENLKNGSWEQIMSDKEFWFDKYEGWMSSGSGPLANANDLEKLAKGLSEVQEN